MTQFKTRLIAALLATAAITTAGSAAAATNLIVNGDFELGNTGFYSSYTFSPGDLWAPAVYDVAKDPHLDHSSFTSFGDHTTGSGKMMEINGSETNHATVWGENNIALTANTNYLFSFWMASEYPSSPAILRLNINGVGQGPAFNAVSTTGLWTQYSTTWNSGANTHADFALWNENLAYSGNDFALDDISLAAGGVPEPATWALLLTGFFGMGSMLRANRRQLARVTI